MKSVERDGALRGAQAAQAATETNRRVYITTPCAHAFSLREDEWPGYLVGVRIVLFACGIVVLVELLLALVL